MLPVCIVCVLTVLVFARSHSFNRRATQICIPMSIFHSIICSGVHRMFAMQTDFNAFFLLWGILMCSKIVSNKISWLKKKRWRINSKSKWPYSKKWKKKKNAKNRGNKNGTMEKKLVKHVQKYSIVEITYPIWAI